MYDYMKVSQTAEDLNMGRRRQDFQKCTSVLIAILEEFNRLLRQ